MYMSESNEQDNKLVTELEFSEKYDYEHAKHYYYKHDINLKRKLTTRREIVMARRALEFAGNPTSVLDLPSGTGRFWEMLAEKPDRKIYAADNSPHMYTVGMELRPKEITSRITETFEASAFAIPKPDNFVENIFCMRLIHHIGKSEDRIAMLKEFARVTSDSVCISMWSDGNYKSIRQRAHERKDAEGTFRNRFVIPAKTFKAEAEQAGFSVVKRLDVLKFYSMWTVFVLKVNK